MCVFCEKANIHVGVEVRNAQRDAMNRGGAVATVRRARRWCAVVLCWRWGGGTRGEGNMQRRWVVARDEQARDAHREVARGGQRTDVWVCGWREVRSVEGGEWRGRSEGVLWMEVVQWVIVREKCKRIRFSEIFLFYLIFFTFSLKNEIKKSGEKWNEAFWGLGQR